MLLEHKENNIMASSLIWTVLIIGPVLLGVVAAKNLSGKYSIIIASFIPGLVFLVFNLYSEYYGQERELLQGTWMFLQATLGTLVGLIGIISYWGTKKVAR